MPKSFYQKTWPREYLIYQNMIQRCYNPKNKDYHRYGGRGIKVCRRWLQSFPSFLKDIGLKPSPELTFDRIDNNGNYEPDNWRWSTRSEQNFNREKWKIIG